MNRNDVVYKHSGAFGPAIVIVPFGGFVSMVILSFIYAYISVYSPIAGYVSFLFVAGFGFGLGFIISMLGYWGKCRNTGFLKVSGFVIGLLGVYVSWVIFIFAFLNKSGDTGDYNLFSMMFSPVPIWEFIKALNESGWYSIKSWTPTGVVLWIFWSLEAVVIIGLSTLLSTSAVESEMFCETCEKWCDSSESFESDFPKEEMSVETIQNNIIETLSSCNHVSDRIYPRIHVTLFRCKTCNNLAGCKLEAVSVKFDKDNKPSEEKEDLTAIIPLSFKDYEKIKALGDRPVNNPEIPEENEKSQESTPTI